MDATCTIQDSIHVFNLVHKYVSRILGTYQYYPILRDFLFWSFTAFIFTVFYFYLQLICIRFIFFHILLQNS